MYVEALELVLAFIIEKFSPNPQEVDLVYVYSI